MKKFFDISIDTIILLALPILALLIGLPVHADLNQSLPQTWQYSHITTVPSTVKSAPGVLHSVVVNTPGAAPCTATVYDGVGISSTIVAVIDCSRGFPLQYDVAFTTGLTINTVGGAPDLTVTFQ